MFITKLLLLFCVYFILEVNSKFRRPYVIDRRSVCDVKTSCLECLLMKHCSWCPTEKKCFSKEFSTLSDYCTNETIMHTEYGFSLEENAECSCVRGHMERNCYPPGVTEGAQCSGRGKCVCGQCICEAIPDPENPTKIILGQYCEYDNFSCKGSRCNEGPYSISQPRDDEEEVEYIRPEIDNTQTTKP